MLLAARLREALGLPGLTVAQTVPVPGQGADEAASRRRGHPDAAAREHRNGRGCVGRRGAHRVPAHRQADRRCRLGRHLPGRLGRRSSTTSCRCSGTCRRSASRSSSTPRSSPTTPSARTARCCSRTSAGTARARCSPRCTSGSAPSPWRCAIWTRRICRAGERSAPSVLKALGFRDGFTHMEWYRKADGEVVFGEIAARPPGARTVDVMNYATDADLFAAWAEAVTHGRISQPIERRYNAASIFKRANGAGRITHYEGLDRLLAEYGEHVAALDLLPVGAPRRDWRATSISDGMVIVRHPELSKHHRDGGPLRRRPAAVRRLRPPGRSRTVHDHEHGPSGTELLQRRPRVLPSVRSDLERLVRIPSVSADPAAAPHLRASADGSPTLLRVAGLPEVEVLRVEGGKPAVLGRRPGPPGAPTVLLYAHHDVQPPGDRAGWDIRPVRADRAGRPAVRPRRRRRQGRHRGAPGGAARARRRLPVGVIVLVEGEEEIGSPTLARVPRDLPRPAARPTSWCSPTRRTGRSTCRR